jgi:hypothetical protein
VIRWPNAEFAANGVEAIKVIHGTGELDIPPDPVYES